MDTSPVALITASTRGLGFGIATAFLQGGYRATISSRTESAVTAAVASLPADLRERALPLPLDVSVPAEIEAAGAQVLARCGRIDTLVVNAGGPPPGTFDDLDEAAWLAAYNLTLMSAVRLVRASLPSLRRSHGRILTVTSSSVREPIAGLMLSNVFRSGVTALVKTLSQELAPDGILVNALAPGTFATDRLKQLNAVRAEKEGRSVEAVRADGEKRVPLGRFGTPSEFGRAAYFLASSENTYITGQTLLIDGGAMRAI